MGDGQWSVVSILITSSPLHPISHPPTPIPPQRGNQLYFVTAIAGFVIGFIVWFMLSYVLARSIMWIEARHPQLVGSKGMRVSEIIACGVIVLGCLALAFWIARLLWLEMKH